MEFKMPDLGENIEAGDIVTVLVKDGEDVHVGQGLVEVETGKATVELPSDVDGKVTKVHVKPGQSVPVGGPLFTIEAKEGAAPAKAAAKSAPKREAAEKPAAQAPAPAKAAPAAKPAPAEKPAAVAVKEEPKAPPAAERAPARPSTNGGPSRSAAASEHEEAAPTAPAGPATRRLARELGVDLSRVSGTGPGGRITEEDVKKAVREATLHSPMPAKRTPSIPDATPGQDQYGPTQVQRLPKIRKTIALNMARSSQTIPHVTNFDDADITELEKMRKGSIPDYAGTDVKLTMMAFVMKAVAHSLQLHPTINATLDLENDQIVYKDYVNLGVAVDAPRGLVVPVLREVDRLTIPQIAQSLTEMSSRARNNQFGMDDMRGGTFTISNLGAIGGIYSTPIINHPEVAILLIGRSRKLPVVMDDDAIKVRLMMPLSLSYDHRLVDGATAARFLNEVKNYLQVPGRLLLAT
ncbi:MAG TPA: dihydrolipoamide acetyltransferase family protein [Pirellulales bacterium]|nr:dihydrolipoamide acetyltransferase family protein [Pirellulales bacterium]